MDRYEITVALMGNTTEAKSKSFLKDIETAISAFGGKVVDSVNWGKKELAYTIKKNTEGVFLHFNVEVPAKEIKELSDKIRVNEEVLRHLVIKVD